MDLVKGFWSFRLKSQQRPSQTFSLTLGSLKRLGAVLSIFLWKDNLLHPLLQHK